MPTPRPFLLIPVTLASLLALSCGGGGAGGVSSGSPVTVTQPVSISIIPTSAQLPRGGRQQFQVKGVSSAPGYAIWKVNGIVGGNDAVGAITNTGLFEAPFVYSPTTVKVTAVAAADPTRSATANISVTLDDVQLTITPSIVNLLLSHSVQFTAQVTGTSNTAVTWAVQSVTGGAPIIGTITPNGLYTAPSSMPSYTGISVSAETQVLQGYSQNSTVLLYSTGSINQAEQFAPIKLGTSGGNSLDRTQSANFITCCSGTLGALVERAGTQYVLSNNHVLARTGQAQPGEGIAQPGLVDFGCGAATQVAQFSQAAPLKTSNVDAALAQVQPGGVDPNGVILQFDAAGGSPPAPAPPASTTLAPVVGMPVGKSGRSTGLSCSTVQSVHVSATVEYQQGCGAGPTFNVTFTDQFVVGGGSFSAAGDSGSLIVNSTTAEAVGLLFAGNSSSTVANTIQSVLAALPDGAGATPTIVGGGPHALPCNWFSSAAQPLTTVSPYALARARSSKEVFAPMLMNDPAIFAVGVGTDERAPGRAVITVYVDPARTPGRIPAMLGGVPTRIIRAEHFRAFGWNESVKRSCSSQWFSLPALWDLLTY
jgi:hypothetical protein